MDELLTITPTSLRRFMARWHGPPSSELDSSAGSDGGATDGVRDGIRDALATFTAYRHVPLQNRIIGDILSSDGLGIHMVYAEKQDVWLWGYRELDDGAVEFVERRNRPGQRWRAVGEDVDTFFVHLAAFEAAWCAPFALWSCDVTRAELPQALRGFAPVATSSWVYPGPGHRLWATEHLLAFSCVNQEPGSDVGSDAVHWVTVASRDPAALEVMRDRPGRFQD